MSENGADRQSVTGKVLLCGFGNVSDCCLFGFFYRVDDVLGKGKGISVHCPMQWESKGVVALPYPFLLGIDA